MDPSEIKELPQYRDELLVYKRWYLALVILLVFMVILSLYHYFIQMPAMNTKKDNAYKLNQHMRRLWSDHVIWTRLYIIAALNNLPLKPTADRLYRNQSDITNALIALVGTKAEIAKPLLDAHINIAATIVQHLKTNSMDSDFKALYSDWVQNARQISGALSEWFNLDLKNTTEMMYQHLDLTATELSAEIIYMKDSTPFNETKLVDAFDAVYNQAMLMADMLSPV